MKRQVRRTCTVVAIAVLGLLIAEGLVRLVGIGPSTWPAPRMLENADKSFGLECYPTDPRGAFPLDIRDAALRARLAEENGLAPARLASLAGILPHCVAFRYNRHTRRGGPFEPPADGTRSVLVVGDSFAEGAGVAEEHTFPARLEGYLRQAGLAVRVHNGGRRGRDLPGLKEDLGRLLPLVEPRVVIYAFMLNDFEQTPEHQARQAFLNDLVLDRQRMGSPTWKLPGWLRHSRLAVVLASWWRRRSVTRETVDWYRTMIGPANREGWERTRRDLIAMNNQVERAGGRFLLAILPLLVGLEGDGGSYPFGELHSGLAAACREAGIEHVDLLPAFVGQPSRELWVHPVDMHPNDRGHEIIAKALAPEVERMLREGEGP